MLPIFGHKSATLTAMSGLHKGTTGALKGVVQLGSEKDSTMRLLDAEAQGHAAELRVGWRSITVTPKSGQIYLNDLVCEGRKRVNLSSGDRIKLRIGSIDTEVRRTVASPFQWRWVNGVVALALAVVLVRSIGPVTSMPIPASFLSSAEEASAMQEVTPTSFAKPSLIEALESRINLLGLNTVISISPPDENDRFSVSANGGLTQNEMTRFREFLAWYDSVPGHPLIRSNVRLVTMAQAAFPKLIMVQLSPVPSVVTSDGRVFGVGAQMPDSWIVVAITPTEFTLERLGATHVIAIKQSEVAQ